MTLPKAIKLSINWHLTLTLPGSSNSMEPLSPVPSGEPIIISPFQPIVETTFPTMPPVVNLDPPASSGIPPIIVRSPIKKRPDLMKTLVTTANDINKLSLIISTHLPAIAKTVDQEDQMLISSATGTGKSLGVPWILARNGNRIVISVPTVAAAESLASRQKTLNPEIEVGYAAEARIHYSEKTQIIYATSGHVRRRFLDFFRNISSEMEPKRTNFIARLINQTDILILDEIHMGSTDDHVNYSLWNYGLGKGYPIPKLILSSATPQETAYPSIFRFSIPTRGYPVQVHYHNRNYPIGNKSLIPDLVNTIYQFHISQLDGDILVFVAGKSEISRVTTGLRELLKPSRTRAEIVKRAVILPAHGNLSHRDFRRIYQRPGLSRETGRMVENPPRKIIIATNIAETSITIEGINIVIDSMTEKRSETSSTGGFRLSLHYISQSSAIQRQGRTGRTAPGICYRMCTAEFFLKLEKSRPEEISRVPIYNTVMELVEVGLRPEDVLVNLDRRSIRQAVSLLTQLKLITQDGKVTEAGHFVTRFPLSVRNSTTLWLWTQENYPLYPAVVTLSLLDSYGPSYFWYPSQGPGQNNTEYNEMIMVHKEKYFLPIEGYSDVDSILNMWNDMTSKVGGPKAEPRLIKDWAVSNSINYRKLREALRIINQVRNGLERLEMEIKIGQFTTKGVVKALRPLAEITYQDLIMTWTKGTQPSYYHPGSKQVYRLDRRAAVNQLTRKPPSRVIPFVMAEIHSGGTIRLINVALDLEEQAVSTIKLTPQQETNLARAIGSLSKLFPDTAMPFES